MWFHVWTFQDGTSSSLPPNEDGSPAFPPGHPPTSKTSGRASQKEEIEGVGPTVDRIMQLMRSNGLASEAEAAIVRHKALEALSERGAYRTALPAFGRYVLAEKIK